jgi:hypothetical protein
MLVKNSEFCDRVVKKYWLERRAGDPGKFASAFFRNDSSKPSTRMIFDKRE